MKRLLVKECLCLFFGIMMMSLINQPANAASSSELPEIAWRLQAHTSFMAPKWLKKYGQKMDVDGLPLLAGTDSQRELSRLVKKRTNGKFTIKVYGSGELFSSKELFEACKSGAVEMMGGYGAFWAGIEPVGYIDTGIPLSVKSPQDAWNLYNETDYIKTLRRVYAKHNLYFLNPIDNGAETLITKFPVNSMDALKGKKIRAVGTKGKVIKALGAIPVYASPAELYTAIQRGVAEGAYWPSHGLMTYGLAEVCQYMTLPHLTENGCSPFYVNMDAWNRLPKDYQNILIEESTRILRFMLTEARPRINEMIVNDAENMGVKSIPLTDTEFAKFQKAALPIWDEIAQMSSDCAELIGIIKKHAKVK
jgi:TRAP-type C4-dicarboxylate transport system substrate-binding protein